MGFRVERQGKRIHITFDGVVTAETLREMAASLLRVEAEEPTIPDRLTDMTSVTSVTARLGDLEEIAALRRPVIFPNMFRSAIIAKTPEQYGYARMFAAMNQTPQITIRIFTDIDDALAWLET